MDDIETLLHDAPRFRAARLTIRHRADRAAYNSVLERFVANPTIRGWVEQNRSEQRPTGVEQSTWRLWLERPFNFRVEELRSWPPTSPGEISGGTEALHWQYFPERNESFLNPQAMSHAVGRLTAGPQQPTTHDDLLEAEGVSALFHVYLHPMVAELLDVGSVLGRVDPHHPDDAPSVDSVGRSRFLDRDAIVVRVVIPNWERRGPMESENFWVADDYELVIDEHTGVVLRLACRADDEEFSVREMSDVAFDEPIDPALFEPPPDARPRSLHPPPRIPWRIRRRLRRRRPPP